MKDARKLEIFNALVQYIEDEGGVAEAEASAGNSCDLPYYVFNEVLEAYKELKGGKK